MQPHRHLGRRCADTYDVCGAGATRGENISLVLEDGREKHRSRSVMREMRILLATSDLFFLYHPPTPSRSLAFRRPTRVRGVGLGFASREPQVVSTELDSESSRTTAYHLASSGKCHETISLCHGAPHATRPYQQRPRTRARETSAHARTLDAARRRCSPAASPERMCKSPQLAMGSTRVWPTQSQLGSGQPTLPIQRDQRASAKVSTRGWAAHRS